MGSCFLLDGIGTTMDWGIKIKYMFCCQWRFAALLFQYMRSDILLGSFQIGTVYFQSDWFLSLKSVYIKSTLYKEWYIIYHIIWYGIPWTFDMIYGIIMLYDAMIWCGVIWCDVNMIYIHIWYMFYDPIRYDAIRYDIIWRRIRIAILYFGHYIHTILTCCTDYGICTHSWT